MPSHPPFIDVKLYPGYSYQKGDSLSFGAGRHVGLARDGEVYVLCLDSILGREKL